MSPPPNANAFVVEPNAARPVVVVPVVERNVPGRFVAMVALLVAVAAPVPVEL